jgi:hypothetical protein
MLPRAAQVIRDIGGKDVLILGWCPANLSYGTRVVGPQELGGYGDLTQVLTLAIETERPKTEIEDEVNLLSCVVENKYLTL